MGLTILVYTIQCCGKTGIQDIWFVYLKRPSAMAIMLGWVKVFQLFSAPESAMWYWQRSYLLWLSADWTTDNTLRRATLEKSSKAVVAWPRPTFLLCSVLVILKGGTWTQISSETNCGHLGDSSPTQTDCKTKTRTLMALPHSSRDSEICS